MQNTGDSRGAMRNRFNADPNDAIIKKLSQKRKKEKKKNTLMKRKGQEGEIQCQVSGTRNGLQILHLNLVK